MKKSIICILLAVVLALSLVACGEKTGGNTTNGGAGNNTSAGNGETAGNNETPTVEKPDSISWWTHSGLNEEDYVQEWDAAFEELVGVDLKHTQVSNNEYATLLDTAFTSGTEPNVFDLSSEQRLTYFASQGGVADLTDLVKASGIYDRVDPAVWEAIAIDGRIYGVPTEIPSGAETYVRQDWLDRLNMDVPTNYDEFITMLRAFRDDIEECTVPLTVPGFKSAMNLPEFYWDAESDFTYVDGKWVDGMQQPNFKDAMQRLHDAYAEGLIDMEAVTNTTSACRDKWYSGGAGVFNYWGGKWGDTLTTNLKANFPEAEVTGIPAIDETYYRYSAFNVYCIDGMLSDEEVAQVFEYFFKVIFDGKEGSALYYAGVEGLHHNTDENGYMTFAPMKTNPDNNFQSVWGTPWMNVVAFEEPEKFPQPSEIVTTTLDTLAASATFKTNTPVSETLNKITADLTSVREETIAKIVMGDISVDEGMEQYYAKAKELGVDQVLAEMNGQG